MTTLSYLRLIAITKKLQTYSFQKQAGHCRRHNMDGMDSLASLFAERLPYFSAFSMVGLQSHRSAGLDLG